MRILGRRWEDGYLDYSRQVGQCRIKTRLWQMLVPIKGLYFVPSKQWSVLINYLREFGVKQVLRKAASRRREALRNLKYLSCGIGEVVECDDESRFCKGDTVVFLAPCHPRCVERLVLPETFVKRLEHVAPICQLPNDAVLFFERDTAFPVPSGWLEFAGWSEFSGSPVDTGKLHRVLMELEEFLGTVDLFRGRRLSIDPPSPVNETYQRKHKSNGRKLKAILFGYGHYAKSIIIPNLPSKILLTTVHEVDPCQLDRVDRMSFSSDSSAFSRPSERYDIYFIAGYHHTHATIAVHALRQGAFAVVEKPLTTTLEQHQQLIEAASFAPGRLFAGFHKRYSRLTEFALKDLGVKKGDPISYHCIVYEVPLPALHWYRWPNSRSRVLSNCCHWIDQFLYLNHFCPVKRHTVWEAVNGDVFIFVELENGASFSMTMTEHGGSRIGVQEHVELRAGDVTVRIQSDSRYVAENSRSILRRCRVNRMESYHRMYKVVTQKIVAGQGGDNIEAIERSSRLVLELEACKK